MATILSAPGLRRFRASRLFIDLPEESLRLRFLILMTVVWVALSHNWVTGSPWMPLAASALAVVGHWISWRRRQVQMRYRSIFVVIAIVGLSIAQRDDFVNAFAGDRLPVGQYLLLINAFASFIIRTRGGLYAQLAISGLVLFFVAERAFDQAFVGFLIVFMGLFLTFAAMAFLEDQISIARVHWPEGQLGRFWFWLGIVGGGLLVCSTLAFGLLPANYRGHSGSQRVGIVPFLGEAGATSSRPSAGYAPAGRSEDGGGASVGDIGAQQPASPREFTLSGDEEFRGQQLAASPRQVVMHVRSQVTSYWRGRLFDRFDGQTWLRSDDSVVSRPLPNQQKHYWQAYFVQQDQPGSVFVGYNPVRVVIPPELQAIGSLVEGSSYSALSQQPRLNTRDIRRDRVATARSNHLAMPPQAGRVRELARDIAGDSATPFDAMWKIVSHLRSYHGFDVTARDQLQLSGPVDDFLLEGTNGTSLDFATAAVLMARALDIPARLAVGYLPGRFDPFSGTHKVRRRDVQAWAEVHLARNGWVAFDATPRPELEVFRTGGMSAFPGGAYIFQTKVGGGLYGILQAGASRAAGSVAQRLEGRGRAVMAGGLAVLLVAVGWTAYRIMRRRAGATPDGWVYSRIPGAVRRDILRVHRGMERELRRRGLDPRGRSQTMREYSRAAAQRFAEAGQDLEWLTRAAWAAAYDPSPLTPDLAADAGERLSRIKRAIAL